MSQLTMFEDTLSATGSAVLADGVSPSVSPAGPTTASAGRVRARVNRSRQQASGKAKRTSGTSGPISFDLSTPSGQLASSVSKCMPLSNTVGSMIYAMTWKASVTPRGRLIYRLVASARRQSGSVCGGERAGYQTPTVEYAGRDGSLADYMKYVNDGQTSGCRLRAQVHAAMAGYPTPNVPNGGRTSNTSNYRENGTRRQVDLAALVQMAGYHTPVVRDQRNSNGNGTNPRDLPRQAALAPPPVTGSTSSTARRGRLNPALSAWLMALPSDWLMAAPDVQPRAGRKSSKSSVTRSSPKSGPRSSGRTAK